MYTDLESTTSVLDQRALYCHSHGEPSSLNPAFIYDTGFELMLAEEHLTSNSMMARNIKKT